MFASLNGLTLSILGLACSHASLDLSLNHSLSAPSPGSLPQTELISTELLGSDLPAMIQLQPSLPSSHAELLSNCRLGLPELTLKPGLTGLQLELPLNPNLLTA